MEALAASNWDGIKDAAMTIFEQKESVEEIFRSHMQIVDVDIEEKREIEKARNHKKRLWEQILFSFSPWTHIVLIRKLK